MKNLKLALALPGMLAIQVALAQTNDHIKLSDQYPTDREKITLTYDPTGTPLDGKAEISAVVYFLDDKDYPAMDVDMKADGKQLKGDFAVPANSKAFVIKMVGDKVSDNNNDKGYIYLVYKDNKPVEGAYAEKGDIYLGYTGYRVGVKSDRDEAITCYKKELEMYPDNKRTAATYFTVIANKPQYKDEFDKKLNELKQSTDEKSLELEYNMLRAANNTQEAAKVKDILKQKFPENGVKNELFNAVMREQDAHKKDSLFNIYAIKCPEIASDPTSSLDNMRFQIAYAMDQKGDIDGYRKYANQIKDKQILAGLFNDVAWNWGVAGKRLDEAEKMSKEAVDIITAKVANPSPSEFTSPKQAKKNAQGSYNAFADTYAYVLWKENKSAEALPYMKAVYDQTSDEANSIEHYSQILAATGQYDKALDVLSTGMKAGQSSDVIKEELKKDYVKVKGGDNGYDKYLASLEKAVKDKLMADLAKTMINQPAPTFTLKDLDGNTVSLADLKGKVVIVDFWATWCGPCKASFPGMQMAVNKYKDNPNVKFLFVDCWENGDKYFDGVKKFIADNKYTFHVLLDEKGDDGRQAKVVSSYKVDGIPTKFIIDKSGNIRFKYVGYTGSSDKVLDEVSNMIELTGNPEFANTATTPATKGK